MNINSVQGFTCKAVLMVFMMWTTWPSVHVRVNLVPSTKETMDQDESVSGPTIRLFRNKKSGTVVGWQIFCPLSFGRFENLQILADCKTQMVDHNLHDRTMVFTSCHLHRYAVQEVPSWSPPMQTKSMLFHAIMDRYRWGGSRDRATSWIK